MLDKTSESTMDSQENNQWNIKQIKTESSYPALDKWCEDIALWSYGLDAGKDGRKEKKRTTSHKMDTVTVGMNAPLGVLKDQIRHG